jgi:hypothetical protein
MKLQRHPLIDGGDAVEDIRDLAEHIGPVAWQPGGKVAASHGLESKKNLAELSPRLCLPVVSCTWFNRPVCPSIVTLAFVAGLASSDF